MSPLKDSVGQYSTRIAGHLRQREANSMRGQPERLRQLDQTTDSDLLRSYSWKFALIAVLVTFFALPLLAMVIRSLLPAMLHTLLWIGIKLAMAASILLLAMAAYLTFSHEGGESR